MMIATKPGLFGANKAQFMRGLRIDQKKEKPLGNIALTYEGIRRAEKRIFPEFKNDDKCYLLSGFHDSYYSPSWHYKAGLLTKEMISQLRSSRKRLLSIGAGPAYMERFLVRLGVKAQNIVLADIDPSLMPTGFKTYKFNMFEEWPEFGATFDYIIFPMSIPIFYGLFKDDTGIQWTALALYSLLCESLSRLANGGQIRIKGAYIADKTVGKTLSMLRKDGFTLSYSNDGGLLVIKTR